MPSRPHPLGLQMLAVALLILGLGFYEQYSEASGVFAPDGLAHKAVALVDSLVALTAVTAETPTPPLATESAPETSIALDAFTVSPTPLGNSSFRSGPGGLGHCSSGRFSGGYCH